MDPMIFGLVMVAAIMHAGWNTLIKSGGAPLIRLAITNGFAALVMLPVGLFVGLPDAASWPFLIASMIVHLFYYVLLASGYRVADLSLLYPIARGSAPPLVALGAFIIAGEQLSTLGIASIALISLAIGLMAYRIPHGNGGLRSVLLALLIGVLIASYTVMDGMGARLTGNAVAYIAWMFVLDGLLLGLWVLARHGRALPEFVKDHWLQGLASGVMYTASYGIVVWAMSVTPMTYVSALRETSVIVAAFLGTRILNEPFGGRRIFAACLVAVGVAILQFSHQ